MERFDVDHDDVARAIAECGLFTSVDGEALEQLIASFDGLRIFTGETLMEEGDEAHEMYIVRHGRLRASVVTSSGDEVAVGEIGKSEVVGEMAVITDQTRSATVRAMRDTDLYRFPAVAFSRLVQHHPNLLRPFATVVVKRLRDAMTLPPRPALPATIVLVPTTADDLTAFAHSLAAELSQFDTVVLGADDAASQPNPAAWLLEIENRMQISLLVADHEPTDWTRLCLRHADRINIVADETAPAGPSPVELDPACRQRLDEVPVHLVMLHRGRPNSTAWLRRRSIESHVNVDPRDRAEMSRLARIVTGRANVLVLGGGGARGFAHFGVARALDEAGIPVDGIIGTSAGAIVGGILARLRDPREAERQMVEWFATARWSRDFNPPSVALMSGRTMTTGLQELGAGVRIEDLPIAFAAISCDLVQAEPFVHDRGPLWQALRASGSVPGLFPPVAIDGRLLVDGGLVANMPSEIARRRHPNATLIAVEVGDPTDIDVGGVDGSGIVNGWERLRRRGQAGSASLSRLMMRLTELGRQDSTEFADVVIRPDVRGFGLTETKRSAEIVERGHAAARSAIESSGLA